MKILIQTNGVEHMINTDYLRPGLTAIALAILTPFFWGYQFVTADSDIVKAYFSSVTNLEFLDFVFLLLGALEIYIFLSVKKILNDRSNFKSVDILLLLLISNSAIYYFGNFGIDLSIFFANDISVESQETLATVSYYMSMGCIFVYGLLDLAIAIILIINYKAMTTWLRVFSGVVLLLGICELTFFFELMLVLYPVTLLILAVNFLQKPEIIEVV